jgi:hypothetical protein
MHDLDTAYQQHYAARFSRGVQRLLQFSADSGIINANNLFMALSS